MSSDAAAKPLRPQYTGSCEAKASCDNSIHMKALTLTCDDYVEQRVPPQILNPYLCMNSLDFTKYSNSVSINFKSKNVLTKH
jgi:hypothetical protein